MSALELVRVDGLRIEVRDLDLLDGTPVLDIKPYVAYVDARPGAGGGWLSAPADPGRTYEVLFDARAARQLEFLRRQGVDLAPAVARALALGPAPHPYRRIRPEGDGMRLALKDWRVRFRAEGERLRVLEVTSGYRPRELAGSDRPELDAHRAFEREFGRR
jgi:tRNA (adenine37-N6)-methyltransferase